MIPAVIDRARSVRIEDELFRRGIKLRGRNGALEGPCPICGGTDRFAVSLKKQVSNCRGCGARGGDTIALVQVLDGKGFREAVEALCGGESRSSRRTGPSGLPKPGKARSLR
jgi:putative DNA primase/helicase